MLVEAYLKLSQKLTALCNHLDAGVRQAEEAPEALFIWQRRDRDGEHSFSRQDKARPSRLWSRRDLQLNAS